MYYGILCIWLLWVRTSYQWIKHLNNTNSTFFATGGGIYCQLSLYIESDTLSHDYDHVWCDMVDFGRNANLLQQHIKIFLLWNIFLNGNGIISEEYTFTWKELYILSHRGWLILSLCIEPSTLSHDYDNFNIMWCACFRWTSNQYWPSEGHCDGSLYQSIFQSQ